MKRVALVVAALIALARIATAAEATTPVAVRETVALPASGATAAYAIDATMADVTLSGGEVLVTGRSPGTTQVIIVEPAGARSVRVTVRASANAVADALRRQNGAEHGVYETRYSSAGGRFDNGFDLFRTSRDRDEEMHFLVSSNLAERFADEPRNVVRTASYTIRTPRRTLTLFDSGVSHSPLTVDQTIVRGVHLAEGGWRLHAGFTSVATFGSTFLSTERRSLAGGGYEFALGDGVTIMPSAFVYPSTRGYVASVLSTLTRPNLHAESEVGYSHGLGAAARVEWTPASSRFMASLRYEPREFDVVNTADLHGFYSEVMWSTVAGRLSADVAASADRYELPRLTQQSTTATANLRYALTNTVAAFTGFNYGDFRGDGVVSHIRSETLPIGLSYDTSGFGVSAAYRYSQNSATNIGGNGFRLAARASAGPLLLSGYVDRQTDAPTLDLIFHDRPDLAIALEQLGISATTPQEIARALRDNAALIQLGFIEGVTVNLAPTRTQAALEAAWLGRSDARPQFRLRLLLNRNEHVASRSTTTIATATFSRRLTAATDVYAGASIAKTDGGTQQIYEGGARRQLDGMPFFGRRTGTISGTVFEDDEILAELPPNPRGIAGVEVQLDGAQTTSTDANGRFTFTKVATGTHRVAARLAGTAYFTTGSSNVAMPGDTVNFGVARTPARLVGTVLDDQGQPVANVTVSLTRGERHFTAASRGDGTYAIAAPPGEYMAEVVPESLPAGVTFDHAAAHRVALERAKPLEAPFVVHINRSIGGRLANARPGDTITIPTLGRTATVDAEGRYLFRSLPAGELTLVARGGGRELHRQVTLGRTASALRDVDFGDETAAARPAQPTPPPVVAADAAAGGRYTVQLGAFRTAESVEELTRRARAAGVPVTVAPRQALTIVQTGSYATRDAADAARERLVRAGFEAFVRRKE